MPYILFPHIPRTGGTTLRRIIDDQYGEDATVLIHDEVLGPWQSLPASRQRQIRAIYGHMRFGLHRHLPGPATYITLLRHPVDRLVSHYRFVRRSRGVPLHDQVVSGGLDLEGYVREGSLAHIINDGQTRLIGGDIHEPGDPATCATLDRAKRNLEEWFTVCGIQERFDESVLLMRRALGWEWPVYEPRNVAADAPDPVPERTRAMIEERNVLDVELHRHASELLEAAVADQGSGFADELREFRRLNVEFREANEDADGDAEAAGAATDGAPR